MGMAKADTERLRRCALELLAKKGHSFKRIHPQKLLYELDDGRTFALATNMHGVLICTTDSPEATARLDFEDADCILFAMPGQSGGVDVYLLPTEKVATIARQNQKEFLQTANTGGRNMTWQQIFDDREGKPSSGYARRYAEHKLS